MSTIRSIKGRTHNEEGFTLIELLIVIVILGILAGIVTFGVATFRDDAKTSCTATNAKLISTAQAAYTAKNGVAASGPQALKDAGYLDSVPGAC